MSLKSLLNDWTDWDYTLHFIASVIGIVENSSNECFLKNKGLYWSNNSTNRYLTFILQSLIE